MNPILRTNTLIVHTRVRADSTAISPQRHRPPQRAPRFSYLLTSRRSTRAATPDARPWRAGHREHQRRRRAPSVRGGRPSPGAGSPHGWGTAARARPRGRRARGGGGIYDSGNKFICLFLALIASARHKQCEKFLPPWSILIR